MMIKSNFSTLRGEVPVGVKIVAVTKNRTVDEILEVIEAGATAIGENRIQEALEKLPKVEGVEKHLIGHLQRNKVKQAVEIFDVIQSVDSARLIEKLEAECAIAGKKMPIYLQINTAADPDKYGFEPSAASFMADVVNKSEHLYLSGLMTIGRLGANDEETKHSFLELGKIFEQIKLAGLFECEHPQLSMGMSGDYKMATECGSTMVRLGSAIFD